MLIVLTTVAAEKDAEELARKIVEGGLAACVQILPKMTSIYKWEGVIKAEPEHLLLIKTRPDAWGRLHEHILANHPYDVPEIAAVESSEVSDPYRIWLESSVTN